MQLKQQERDCEKERRVISESNNKWPEKFQNTWLDFSKRHVGKYFFIWNINYCCVSVDFKRQAENLEKNLNI